MSYALNAEEFTLLQQSIQQLAQGQPVHLVSRSQHNPAFEQLMQALSHSSETLNQAIENSLKHTARFVIENLLDRLPSPAWISDAAGLLQHVNPHTLALLGFSDEALLGQPANKIFYIQRESAVEPVSMDELLTLDVSTSTCFLVCSDQQLVPISVSSTKVCNADNQVALVVCIAHDMSKQKELEQQLTEQLHALQQARHKDEMSMREAQAEREKAEASEQAMHALKDKAESANQLKSDFLAMVSHELRTPMNGILAMNELLLDSELNAECRDYVQTIQVSAEAMRGLVVDLVDFAKLNQDKVSIENVPIDLRQVLEQAADLTAQKAFHKGLDFNVYMDPKIPSSVLGDPFRLQQILINLINNAIKFTPSGEVWVEATRVHESDRDIKLQFSVSDTGIGIHKDMHAQIFEPFMQADLSTTRKYGGMGLGLSISQQIAQKMNGNMGVVSELNQGSTFWLEITLSKIDGLPPEQHQPWTQAMQALVHGTCPTVLLVDPHHQAATLLGQYFDAFKWPLQTVDNLDLAWDLIEKQKITPETLAAILVDAQSSGNTCKNPLVFAEKIRTMDAWAHTPLILLLSFGQRDDILKYRQHYQRFLAKPIKLQKLINVLAKDHPASDASAVSVVLVEDHPLLRKTTARLVSDLGYHCHTANHLSEIEAALTTAAACLLSWPLKAVSLEQIHDLRQRYPDVCWIVAQADTDKSIDAHWADLGRTIAKPLKKASLAQALASISPSESSQNPAPQLDMSPEKSSLLDYHAALEKFNGDAHFLKQALNDFVCRSKEQIPHIQAHIESGAFTRVFQQAAQITESAQYIKAKTVIEASRWLESSASEKNVSGQHSALQALDTELRRLEQNFFVQKN